MPPAQKLRAHKKAAQYFQKPEKRSNNLGGLKTSSKLMPAIFNLLKNIICFQNIGGSSGCGQSNVV